MQSSSAKCTRFTALRTMDHVVCTILIHFLVAFAQGQGPGLIEMALVEESPSGTIVGSVAIVRNYSYTFQDPTSLFEINSSGTVRTLQVIDREALPNPAIRLYVIGSPVNAQDRPITFTLVITILDINDNVPVFMTDGGRDRISFQEDAREGRKNIVTAKDPDEGANGTIGRYDIVSGNDAEMFGLDSSGLPLILYIYKKSGQSFDREKLDRYQLNISARDNGSPPRYGFMLVEITILDVNDNTPAFDFSEYTTQVNESAPVGTSVFRAEATDSDLGLNGEILYRLEDESHQFRIDENTGVISTMTSPLKCSRCERSAVKCNPNSCFILVEASDKGLNALTGRAYVYIEVLDENDHDPVITFTKDGMPITSASVDENAGNQTSSVFAVSVTDRDNGANGETTLRIIKGNEEGYFFHLSLPAYGFNEIQVARQLDRETIGKFNLTFEAVDKGVPPRSSTAYIIIIVNDANDHAPEFEFTEKRISLSEFTKPNSYVASVRATDKDEGVNSKLIYEISAGNEVLNWFVIDATTGLVTTGAKLDHEEASQVILNISARDGGADPKYSYATLVIDIQDENDYVPKFSQSLYSQELMENSSPSASIVTLKATDLDNGDNGTVQYFIHQDTEIQYPNTFSVDATSGKVTALRSFDRELRDKYIIKVVARDKGLKPLSATASIELTIKDENDNRPKFSPKEYYVNIFDSDSIGLQIVRVQARDKDIGEFGKITYSIFSDACTSFKINADSGVISIQKALGAQKKCSVTVRATDGGGSTADNDAVVTVIVIGMSSVGPEFTNSSYEFAVTEDNGELPPQIGRTVERVEASSLTGKTVTYAITSGDPDGVFKIDASSGMIRNQLSIDREEKSKYTLTVIAYDGEKISSRTVTIIVKDLNDNAPSFVPLTTEATVQENMPVGHNIFLAQAIDLDADNNRIITYSLSSPRETNGVFVINASTGVISLSKPASHMLGSSAILNVTATDSGTVRKSSTMSVIVRIEDVNNHTPVFIGSRYDLFLSESQSVNEIVRRLSAADSDKGTNGELTYFITRGNEDKRFGIFPDGSLFVAHELDRETRDMYSLTIVVKDHGSQPRSSSINMTIYVLDENDNNPEFSQDSYELSIMENRKAKTFVGAVKANDGDIGRNAEILYSLGDGNDNFSIDPIMGIIYSKRSFDREYIVKTTSNSYYVFDVYATDNGMNKLQSKISVKVNILDENDCPPVFVQTPGNTIAINEHSKVRDVVYILQAVDADEGANAAISYAIISGNDAGKFGVQAANGQLYLKDTLDREVQDQYLLTIKATDTGADVQLEASMTLQIFVVDYNDNVPQFAPGTNRTITVSESTKIGQVLVTFSGSDKDMGNNGKLRYDIVSGNEDDIFALDVYSGKLSLARNLDFESLRLNNGEHTLNITLSDSGFPALSVALIFVVKVTDANDNTPEFTDGLSKVYAKENIDRGSKIADLTAIDRDSGDYGRVLYRIFKQAPGGDHFAINETTGEITVNTSLDREQDDTFKVTIQAIDQDSEKSQRKTAEKSLTILVEDVNDNAPVFMSPAVFLVPTTSSGGSTVASVLATDRDHGDNSKVTYSFSGQKPALFNLNPTTGTISLAQSLAAYPYSYTLAVTATDGGKDDILGAKSTTQTVTILLYTSSSGGPSFSSTNPTSGSVKENVNVGTSIMRITAVPSRSNSKLEFYITKMSVSGRAYSGLFSIDRNSGVISTAGPVDRELLPGDIFQVDVSAVESDDTGQRVTTSQVTIQVEDENDNVPMFSSSLFDASVSESILPGASVTWIHVSDADSTGKVVLSLGGLDSVKFRIEQNGTLFAKQALDYENQTSHSFSVEATDGISRSSALVYISVLDENDHSPTFSQAFYSFDVSENAEIGYTIGAVPAKDADSGSNGHVMYEYMSEWGQDYFQLNSQSGTFILKKQPDFEERQLYALRVIAKDGGLEPRSTEVRVYMNVKDVNDNQPEFDPMSYYREISEDAAVGTLVVNVSATDVDSGLNGDVRYSILGDASTKFGIGPINGSVYTTGALDRETVPVYTIVVMATDQAPNVRDRMSTTTTVQVKLTDINDSPPVFLSPELIEINENAKVQSTVYTIQVEDLDEGINSKITYRLVSQSADVNVFSIDSNSGALVLKSQLDRESVSNYTLVIEAKDGGTSPKSATQTLVVKVGDANDNPPKFTQSRYTTTQAEDLPVGESVHRVHATDLDEGLNGAVRYFIIGGEGSQDFHLDMSSGVLRLHKSLDYERTPKYIIVVQAEDSSVDNPLHTNATVEITVTDINDFVPVFDDTPYDAYVQEGMKDGPVPVITITARDEDSGNNSLIQYSLRDINSYTNMFAANSTSGEIFVVKTLDREMTPFYVLTLAGIDRGAGAQTGSATVTVFVMDVNDHSPTFESSGPYLAHIMENKPQGTEVIRISATDMDEGMNADITYSLEDSMNSRFTIVADSGRILTSISLDRELESQYTLTVIATDHGIPPRSSSVLVMVLVDDFNDHAPEFGTGSYTATMYDTSKTGDFVIGATAIDQDVGNNGKVVYALEGADASYFQISSDMGVVTIAKPLTQEKRRYTFTVQASDQGTAPLASTASVVVNLLPASSTGRPKFTDFGSNAKIIENADIGRSVTTVQATSTTNSRITYHIAGGNVNNAFTINSDSGVISVAGRIDYEVTKLFNLWLEARDQRSTQPSTFQQLTVVVEDENDNAPVFSNSLFTAEIDENCRVGTTVIQIMATDQDSGTYQQIVYAIKNGNENNTFAIDSSSGLVTTINPSVDREKIALYNIEIEASDMGIPKRSATATIRITIRDLNDNQPTFTGSRSVAVPEDLPIGSLIMQLTTTDLDIGENARATFQFENINDTPSPFAIKSSSGNITNTQKLDAETRQRYQLSVTVTDGSFIQKTILAIRILDVNDNPPKFQSSVLMFNFTELQPPNTRIAQLTALDLDKSSPNNKSFFSLKRPSSLFELNSETGVLVALETMHFFGGQPPAQSMNDHFVDVLVTDLGIPSLSSMATVVIRVTDANDHAPVFQKDFYFSAVPNTLPLSHKIIQLVAEDKFDYGKNADVSYEIISGSDMQLFAINSTSGVIYPKASLTGQVNKKFSLIVKSKDGGVPTMSSNTTVELQVTEDNNHAPRFNSNRFQKQINESVMEGFIIDTVTATDLDQGLNGEVEYYITAGNDEGLFIINKTNGTLMVKGKLDYETKTYYNITITARDKALFFKEASKDFEINILDVNDNKPMFDKDYYDAYILENSKPNSPVFKVLATDADTLYINTEICYSIVGNLDSKNFFKINEKTGDISSANAVFDYEERTLYTLLVMAFNHQGNCETAVLKSVTTVYVHITGQNEDRPQFVQKTYNFGVNESAEMGTPVGQVKALDNDHGVDGIVYYYLEGQSNLKGFIVEPVTGIVKVSRRPDYESSPHIILSIIAKNWGSIQGNDTDTCTVNITVSDANDPPEFSKDIYHANVSENSASHTYVTTVIAEDKDIRPENRDFSYEILSGNELGIFQITSTGKIETTGLGVLDRETTAKYSLIVGARDKRDPKILGSATVEIELLDVNDNGPVFNPVDLKANVSENETAGIEVIVLRDYTTDPDLPPNQGPYTYRMVPGPWTEFFSVNEITGRVETKQILNRDVHPKFIISVIVTDNGSPKMTSTLSFTIVVNDINNSQPKPRPLTVYVSHLENVGIQGKIADVHPLDTDLTGKYTCSIVDGGRSLFAIKRGCDLEVVGSLPDSTYIIKVQGADDKFPPVEYNVTVVAETVTNKTLTKSVAVILKNEAISTFLEKKFLHFKQQVEEAFGTSFKCKIFSLKEVNGGLYVMLYVHDREQMIYLSSRDIQRGLTDAKVAIETSAEVSIQELAASRCNVNPCRNGGACFTIAVFHNEISILDSSAVVLTSPVSDLATSCFCSPAYTGPICDQQQKLCGTSYCSNGGTCVSGTCECPDEWTGNYCQTDVNECQVGSPCKNGATCRNTKGSFQCECSPGYHGPYCDSQNFCTNRPCSEHGKCKELPDSFQCICDYGYHGANCQFSSMSFEKGSYAQFRPANNYHTMNITMYLATIETNALLMFSPFIIKGGAKGFVAMEIVSSKVKVSFLLDPQENTQASRVVSVSTRMPINNGYWHRLDFVKSSTFASLMIQKCVDSVCEPCTDKETACYNETSYTSLNERVQGQYISIGGVRNFRDILDQRGHVSTHDFRGCLHSININGLAFVVNRLDPGNNAPEDMYNVSDTCPRTQPSDSCHDEEHVCYNSGICVDRWSHMTCKCSSDYMDDLCLIKKQPFSLGSNAMIKFSLRPSYVRDVKLTQLVSGMSRKRRALNDSTFMLRFRTKAEKGVLYSSHTDLISCLIWFADKKLHFLLKSDDAVIDPLSIEAPDVSDSNWHNVSVTASGMVYKLDLDGQSSGTRNFGVSFDFNSLDVLEMAISGKATVPNNMEVNGLDGCVSQLLINGESLPLNGSSEKYNIKVLGEVEGFCSALCENNPCGGDNKCVVEGEGYHCLLVAVESAGLETGIIVVIVFFAILLISIVVVFVLFHTRRDMFHRCVRSKKQSRNGASSSGKINVDNIIPAGGVSGSGSRFALNPDEEEMIIRNHIVENLSGQKPSSLTACPDLLGPNYAPQALQLPDGTVIMETTAMNNILGEEDIPEHYDFENASSIAPSDIAPSDMIRHYRDFRNGAHHHHHHHHHHHQQQPLLNSHLFNKYRESPASISASNYRASPNAGNLISRQSPVSLLGSNLSVPGNKASMTAANGTCPNSALVAVNHHEGARTRISPLTQLNVRSPRAHPQNFGNNNTSRSNSIQSIGSHHSHSSSSSATAVPNGHIGPYTHSSHKHSNNKSTSGNRSRTPKGLTVEDVNRLNARPDHTDPVSLMDAASSSIDGHPRAAKHHIPTQKPVLNSLILLEPPDCSSDDSGANDSFTCSEFEYDNDNGKTRLDLDPGKMSFSKLTEVENESDDIGPQHQNQNRIPFPQSHGFQSNEDSHLCADVGTSSGSPASVQQHSVMSQYDFDALLNWGPGFNGLVGVFRDIAQLPDMGQKLDGVIEHDYEEYV